MECRSSTASQPSRSGASSLARRSSYTSSASGGVLQALQRFRVEQAVEVGPLGRMPEIYGGSNLVGSNGENGASDEPLENLLRHAGEHRVTDRLIAVSARHDGDTRTLKTALIRGPCRRLRPPASAIEP